jgi:hypothetical protein
VRCWVRIALSPSGLHNPPTSAATCDQVRPRDDRIVSNLEDPVALDAPALVLQAANRRRTNGTNITALPRTADLARHCFPTHLPFPTPFVNGRVQRRDIKVSVGNFQVGPRCPATTLIHVLTSVGVAA